MTAYDALIRRAEEIASRSKPFATTVRPKARPGDPNFIGPVEQIGPRPLPRSSDLNFTGPVEPIGPQLPRPGESGFVGPVEQMGPRMPARPGEPGFIGPMESVGPQLPPRPGSPNFVGPMEQVGPQIPRPGDPNFVGPMGQIGPRQLPRPGEPGFVGPLEPIGPNQPTGKGFGAGAAGSPYSGSYLPVFAGTTLAGTALLSGGQQASDQDRLNRFAQIYGGNATSSPYSLEEANRNAAINAVRGRPEFEQGPVGSGRGAAPPSMDAYLADRAKATAANAALDAARARTAPMPPSRELQAQARAAQPSDGGFLSRIFSGQDYQSSNALSRDPRTAGYSAPVVQNGQVNWGNPDSAADFFRADKALMQMKAQQAADSASGTDDNRKRGGMVSGKGHGHSEKMPDPIHKALEIIHALLIRH